MSSSRIHGLISLRRSSTQRKVLYFIIENENGATSDEIAKELKISVNAVNLALHHLHKKGLVRRISRGVYTYNLGVLLIPLLHEYLRIRKRRR